jgi:hypothetical protein
MAPAEEGAATAGKVFAERDKIFALLAKTLTDSADSAQVVTGSRIASRGDTNSE